eukprot:scaffold8637_cov153-Skeletonema_dohrnii-CCMP3373.AAC.15
MPRGGIRGHLEGCQKRERCGGFGSCAIKCHDDIEDDCEEELDPDDVDEEGENDCGGLHNDLEKCYKKCYDP